MQTGAFGGYGLGGRFRARSGGIALLRLAAALGLAVTLTACSDDKGSGKGEPPITPWNLTAAAFDESAQISWHGVDDATAYHVYYSTAPGAGTAGERVAVDDPELQPHTVVGGLENYQRYYFVVTASNKHGESAPSSEVSAIPSKLVGEEPLTDEGLVACLEDTQGGRRYTEITMLTCQNHGIQDLTDVGAYLLGLETLTIEEADDARSDLADLSPLTTLEALRSVTFRNQSIEDLSPLAEIEGLTYITVSKNSVSNMQPAAGMGSLLSLNLDWNSITAIPDLSGLTALTHLYLATNNINNTSGLAGLGAVTFLTLSRNAISDLSPLAGLTTLTNLELSRNTIGSDALESLSNLTGLTHLYLDDNAIDDPSALAALSGLQQLDLRGNQIDKNLGALSTLTHLESLDLRYNTIGEVPSIPCEDLQNLINALEGVVLPSTPVEGEDCAG